MLSRPNGELRDDHIATNPARQGILPPRPSSGHLRAFR
jgi:hypothetical protein